VPPMVVMPEVVAQLRGLSKPLALEKIRELRTANCELRPNNERVRRVLTQNASLPGRRS
jgi:hypothetical protein